MLSRMHYTLQHYSITHYITVSPGTQMIVIQSRTRDTRSWSDDDIQTFWYITLTSEQGGRGVTVIRNMYIYLRTRTRNLNWQKTNFTNNNTNIFRLRLYHEVCYLRELKDIDDQRNEPDGWIMRALSRQLITMTDAHCIVTPWAPTEPKSRKRF